MEILFSYLFFISIFLEPNKALKYREKKNHNVRMIYPNEDFLD